MNDSSTTTTDEVVDTTSRVPLVLSLVVMLLAAYGAFKWWQVEQARQARERAIPAGTTGPPLTQFELTERSGQTFRSADMQGQVWVVTYFFTTCPGNCIRLNQNIKALQQLSELEDVTWVSITCDPDNDTVEALRKYADQWEADPDRWLFCRADLPYIKRVAAGMHLDVYRRGHKDFAVVMDKTGRIRDMLDATSQRETVRLTKLLVELLQEEPSIEPVAVEHATTSTG